MAIFRSSNKDAFHFQFKSFSIYFFIDTLSFSPMQLKQQRIIAQTKICIEMANRMFDRQFPLPNIRFDIRGKTAGMALLQRWEIRFNPILLSENDEAFLTDVVPHEVAHLIVYALYGNKARPHGDEWKFIMSSLFNRPPHTRHTFDVTSVEGKTFLYQCHCSTVKLSIHRHNKVCRGQARYICRKCKHVLVAQCS